MMSQFALHCAVFMISLMTLYPNIYVTAGDHPWKTIWKNKKSDKCPLGASVTQPFFKLLDTLFPELFVNPCVVNDTGFNRTAAVITVSEPIQILDQQVLAQSAIENRENTSDPKNIQDGCCEMVTAIIKPIQVQQNGNNFLVVHLVGSEQLVTTSSCVNELGVCLTTRRCVSRKGYNWVLVYDLSLDYYPPVRFIPLEVNVGCECL